MARWLISTDDEGAYDLDGVCTHIQYHVGYCFCAIHLNGLLMQLARMDRRAVKIIRDLERGGANIIG